MVVKPIFAPFLPSDVFESRVILDGSQTATLRRRKTRWFESRVILDGSQTGFVIGVMVARV